MMGSVRGIHDDMRRCDWESFFTTLAVVVLVCLLVACVSYSLGYRQGLFAAPLPISAEPVNCHVVTCAPGAKLYCVANAPEGWVEAK